MDYVKNLVEGYIKSGYTRSVKQIMKDVGDLKITDITLYRTPINSVLDKAINMLSLGTFDEFKKSKGYDSMFHLYMVVTLENGEDFLVEHNETINVNGRLPKTTDQTETMRLGNPGGITLNEMLENTRKRVGDHDFFVYEALGRNCQWFISQLLQTCGLFSDRAKEFVMQDVEQYAKDNGMLSQIANTVTDAAAAVGKAGNEIGVFRNGGLVSHADYYRQRSRRKYKFRR